MTAATLISRAEFNEAIAAAVRDRRGYAAGKLCESERAWMYYPMLLASEPSPLQLRAFEQALVFRGLHAAGAFPAEAGFYREFAALYGERLRALDCVGLQRGAFEETLDILRFHDVGAGLIPYEEQEPDRSV